MISLPAAADTVLATPRRLNSTSGFSRTQKLASQVDVDDGLPLLKRHLVDRRIALQTRIGDHDMQRAEMRDGLRKHRLDLVLVPDIGLDRQSTAAAGLDGVRDVLGRDRVGDVVGDHIGAGSSKS